MSVENAKEFLRAFQKDESLRKDLCVELDLEQSLVKLQQKFRPELPFTTKDLETALEELLGEIYKKCIFPMCFSEVPGY